MQEYRLDIDIDIDAYSILFNSIPFTVVSQQYYLFHTDYYFMYFNFIFIA